MKIKKSKSMMFNDCKMTRSVRQQMLTKKFKELQRRILKNLEKGIFFFLRKSKQQQRLKCYVKQLNTGLRPTFKVVLPVLFSVGLLISTQSVAQTFTEQTGASNPFDGEDVGDHSIPAFVDIDNDGDFDVFIGEDLGTILYYENTGTNSAPAFTQQTGVNNPFNGENVGTRSAPTFVDIDNDGDFDAFIGERDGFINYYENTGTNSVPTFTAQTGGSNPFNGVDVGLRSVPTFVDIDNDGDFDAFIGENAGIIFYYENTGTNSAPTFTEQTGASNPFNGVDIGYNAVPTFVDIDNDMDFDAFIGERDFGYINYYENTGTNSAPTFTEQTGGSNPFDGVSVGNNSLGNAKPTFVDIDNDGDFDVFSGERFGAIFYYKNAPLLPVELTFFKGITISTGHLLTWQTASEENNRGFEIERSSDGKNWENIGFVEGHGTTQETKNYTYFDETPNSGNNYYRLKQVDFDGQFEYSDIVNIKYKVLDDELNIFPNPVQNELNIVNTQGQATIYNSLGQSVQSFSILNSPFSINTTDLPKGQYILRIQQENGQFTTKQFIK
jgi:hypothetical protein